MANELTLRSQTNISLAEYASHVRSTNKIKAGGVETALLGLFGEVGSLLSTAKKGVREEGIHRFLEKAFREELGDILWYFTLISHYFDLEIEEIFSDCQLASDCLQVLSSTDIVGAPLASIAVRPTEPIAKECFKALGRSASELFSLSSAEPSERKPLLASFARDYLLALHACGISLSHVIIYNVEKTYSRFGGVARSPLPEFDDQYLADEQIPRNFEIHITKRPDKRSVLKWNGVIIGDPLSDNILAQDGYRYHDVFHLAHAAILGWSPVFRALIRHKRRTNKKVDEAEDGGRAIVIEEGLTAWIFARSKDYDYFSEMNRLPFDLLKIVQQFVDGYEVSECPLWLWEQAILDGYAVFRQVRANDGGIITGNRDTRQIRYRPLS